MLEPVFHRILLKLSGEIFAGKQDFGIDPEITVNLAKKIISPLGAKYIAVTLGSGGALLLNKSPETNIPV